MIRIHCDGGCGASTDNPQEYVARGYVKVRHYCPKCDEKAAAYQAELDAVHTAAARSFEDFRSSLRERYGKDLEALPDV